MEQRIVVTTAAMAVIILSLVAGCGGEREAIRSDIDGQHEPIRSDIDGQHEPSHSDIDGQHEPSRSDVDGQHEPIRSDLGKQSTPVSITVALLGNPSRVDLLESIASTLGVECKTLDELVSADVHQGERTFRFRATRDETTVAQARLAWEADLVLLAVDASDGPLQVHREHAILARQMAVPDVAVALTNSQLVDDSELIELVQLEVRQLLNNYELPGDDVLYVFDHAEARNASGDKFARGPLQIVKSLDIVARRRPSEGPLRECIRVSSDVYFLGQAEVYPPDIATIVQSGQTTVLMRGELFEAKIETSAEISPGSASEVDIVFDKPAQITEAQRFALLNEGHIAAIGVFTPTP